ncbi:DUF6442 family protein [Peptoniphilus indolicus]|uniref:Uncharacterized protein n=2 Tax=Peptoniphilus indolicus TaxID=33030 RepID=G4D412_9FIRM|nr:DUF6442 family protein [Peptoniphilus indolicus]EGY79738.1 hypothetical protein HMPREF9129_1142 [Peptoniphilus indolicus ATCC 29427]SUB75834.1 Uncharacterised protein [Peptoniphilus indolicus]
MLKEEILKKSRDENFDEAKESYSMQGLKIGFNLMSLVFVLIYVSCAIRGKDVVWRESILGMYLIFVSSQGYTLYRFNRQKFYLFQFLVALMPAVILILATLYWIWLK